MSDLRTPLPITKRIRRCLRLWAIEIGTLRGIRTLSLLILSQTQLPVMLPGH